ncbi:hypothetical protein AMATHDRAFT_141770 [Amanita thiersii Skay4041]|uniref:Uncharacterized protein n=1 Tax=Amanita thiersii Skay4041 TaxID=703135 RepID=A0A2A9NRB1_9AGAR|nr:hypothetical protein AMATHDRAFT_141770 [Amanita thiersii Skay4041]
MDLPPIHPQEATSSSSASVSHQQSDLNSTASSTDFKTLRSSARVKAAKQNTKLKGKDKERDLSNSEQTSASSTLPTPETPATRVTPRRTANTSTPTLTINESIKDTKGKKRAAPEPSDEDSTGPSTKRTRTAYSSRLNTVSTDNTAMNRKTRYVVCNHTGICQILMLLSS